ncbi:MFS transporter [Naumannella halotolerans]|uniref:Putative MFS transporter n=1 Tax=Naumannella halotolerans TaxID=993414 RepID=A0A4R7J644_9ACTN|nr:MFS transporter [Naumannella halotolerans]TDT32655.1 putative MFS transporter [Naumannella halotolerans]
MNNQHPVNNQIAGGQGPTLTRTERLDRLRFNRAHANLLGRSGVGWALDAMDVGLISYVMVAVGQQWALSSTELSLVGAIGFAGMAVGASLGGLLADRFGRRQVFALTLLVYGLATGASALAGGLAVLIALRFLVGIGLGAELPVASTLVSEYAPKHIRGRVVVALEAFWALGWVMAALLGFFLVPSGDNGWRWALAFGLVPAIYAIVIRLGLPESVRFLESRGRHAEAEEAVRRFEAAGGARPHAEPDSAVAVDDQQPTPGRRATPALGTESIWSKRLRSRTIALWIIWFCINFSYYGAFIWLPQLLVDRGFPMVRSFEYTLIITIAQLPGYLVAAILIEKIGRRSTLAIFLTGSAISAAGFGLAETPTMIIVAGCALSFFNLGAWGALYAIGPEIYPTTARGKGTGAAAAFGRIASILAPLSVPVIIGFGGPVLLFGVFGVAFAIAAIAVLGVPEMRNVELEEGAPTTVGG